jgi:hypothetical protein
MATNLPSSPTADSATATRLFFDSYGEQPLEFNSTDVDATVGFFESKGFDRDAATTTAITLLKQAKIENQPIFQILDTLKGFNDLQLSALVGEILNNNRPSTSTLGFRVANANKISQTRNILL